MAHRHHGSLTHQAEKALKRIFTPGESKHEHKIAGDALDHIYAIETLRTYLKHSVLFLCWAQERGVRDLADLNKRKYRKLGDQWLRECLDAGMSASTVRTKHAALWKLKLAIRSLGLIEPDLVSRTRELDLPQRRLVDRIRGGAADVFSREEARRIADLAALGVRSAAGSSAAVQVIYHTGARSCELRKLRVQDVHIGADCWHTLVRVARGQPQVWTPMPMPGWAVGTVTLVGKGGRIRQTPVDTEAAEFLTRLIAGKQPGDLLVPRGKSTSAVNDRIEAICRQAHTPYRSEHVLRAAWANRMLDYELAEGLSDTEGRHTISRWLGHERQSVQTAYIPPRIHPGRRPRRASAA